MSYVMSGSSSRLKIILSQLPHPSYVDRNVPLAAGYLKASAYRFGLLEEVDIEILDPVLSDYSGCQRLISTLTAMEPDILGFSLYLWNADRTLYVIQKIKAKLPHLKIFVGGPEVTRDSTYVLSNPNIDIAVLGEGEMTFVELVNHLLKGRPELEQIPGICYRKNGGIVVNTPRKRLVDLELIPSPYLLGYIDPKKYREMMLFTMRGCMLGCTYCSWTSRGRLRAYTIERLRKELTLAKETGEETIVSIVDSAFNVSPVFAEFCRMAQEINQDKALRFHCFVQADLVDEGIARLIKQSNFIGVEVGLQSANPEVLARVNRSLDLNRFLRGVNLLRKEGVPVEVDTIVGLPGDSSKTFEETMTFISDNNLDPILFNLSLGHGAKLTRQRERFGANVQTAPPFYVLETSTLPRQEIEKTVSRYKHRSADFDRIFNLHYPSILSRLNPSCHDYASNHISYLQNVNYPIRNIVLNMDVPPKAPTEANKLAEMISQKVASNLSILCLGNDKNTLAYLSVLRTLLLHVSEKNPYITWDIFLETEDHRLSQALLEEILSFIRKPKVFLDYRDELFPRNMPCVRRKSVNIFALLPWQEGRKGLQLDESNCIFTLTIGNPKTAWDQIKGLLQAKGCGSLIDFSPGSDIDFVRESMSLLYKENQSGRGVFFKNWVLQRLWEQEFLKITPERQAHYELVINRDMSLFGMFLDENELLWDAVTDWKLVNPKYSSLDIEKAIFDKVSSMFSAGDQTGVNE
jgi:uncharacterized radical SAM superfamily protein